MIDDRVIDLRVHEGADGWLFLVGGPNRPLSSYRFSTRRWWRLGQWARLIRRRERRSATMGARYLHAVVPEKLSIYADQAPSLGIDPTRSPALALGWRLRGCRAWVDLTAPLLDGRRQADMYLRTDTHWTIEGCHVAYRALCAAAGADPHLVLAACPTHDIHLVGDLGMKLDPPRGEPSRRYGVLRDAVRTYANALVVASEAGGDALALHRGAHVVFRNPRPDADPRRVVLFGDSCAHFDPFMLTGMLAETFRELHFIWSASIDWEYVETVRPDLVIAEIAERFMFRAPDDTFDVEAFAADRLSRYRGEGAQLA